ncbi:putative TetR family transcriptional regulator [Microbacterium sp. HM58-2]|nr:putative TetR family transcriptional regulator [Microbacterium sp. HM58-2]
MSEAKRQRRLQEARDTARREAEKRYPLDRALGTPEEMKIRSWQSKFIEGAMWFRATSGQPETPAATREIGGQA